MAQGLGRPFKGEHKIVPWRCSGTLSWFIRWSVIIRSCPI